jgi:hypothetical protein
MSTDKTTGQNYEVSANKLHIFNWGGARIEDGNWVIDFGFWVEVGKDLVSPEIEALITQDSEAGNEYRISYILTTPAVAGILFLEGKITAEMVRDSVEIGKSVRISGVMLCGKSYDVLVMDNDSIQERYGNLRFATMTADHQVV